MTETQATDGAGFTERTEPLLKPRQVDDMKEQHDSLERSLSSPQHISGMIQDKPAMFRQMTSIRKTLEKDMPREYSTRELDLAKKRENLLITKIKAGMPTHEEMRRNPPGAVDKHRAWEARNKKSILEWKNIRKRLQVSGAIDDCLPDSTDVSNIEKFRPFGGAQQLNLQGAQIEGKEFHMDYHPKSVVFQDSEIEILKSVDPELAKALCTLPAETRLEIKSIIKGLAEAQVQEEAKPEVKPVAKAKR